MSIYSVLLLYGYSQCQAGTYTKDPWISFFNVPHNRRHQALSINTLQSIHIPYINQEHTTEHIIQIHRILKKQRGSGRVRVRGPADMARPTTLATVYVNDYTLGISHLYLEKSY